jgi:hypothetical protein
MSLTIAKIMRTQKEQQKICGNTKGQKQFHPTRHISNLMEVISNK